MKKKYGNISLILFVMVLMVGLYLYFFRTPKPSDTQHPAPLAEVAACGDLSLQLDLKPILADTSFLSKSVASAVKENASAIPMYATQLLKKNGFQISVTPANDPSADCKFSAESPKGRPLLCVNQEKKKLSIVLKKDEDLKDSFDSQVNVSLLPGVFSLVYDYFWRQQEDHYLDLMSPTPGKPIDASEKPLNDYQKFSFWRYKTISNLKLFSNPDLPFLDFGASGPLSPTFVRRGLILLSSEYYCRPESHKNLAERHPEFYKEFSQSLACVLGKPWFMNDADYQGLCPQTR
ncbi:MAG: hypothetical protein WCI18_11500 [Pseudomonadota bacterium]